MHWHTSSLIVTNNYFSGRRYPSHDGCYRDFLSTFDAITEYHVDEENINEVNVDEEIIDEENMDDTDSN